MDVHTRERSLSNVIYVVDVSRIVAIFQSIDEYIPVTSGSCVNFAARVFIDVEILLFTVELIQARSHTSANSVVKIFVEGVISPVIVVLILERNHLNASTVENSSLEVDIWCCTFGHTRVINLIFVKSVAKIFVLREN